MHITLAQRTGNNLDILAGGRVIHKHQLIRQKLSKALVDFPDDIGAGRRVGNAATRIVLLFRRRLEWAG